MRNVRTVASCVVATALTTGAFAGPDWVEGSQDAGSLLSTAQLTLGVGQLTSISGSLSAGLGFTGKADYEDMFLIAVLEPSKFSLTVNNANFDAQLWLFNVTLAGQAFGLLANDDTIFGTTPVLTPIATDGSGAELTMPGIYAIAISGKGRVPISSTGAIFNFQSPFEISGADGPGGINPHIGWTGEGEVGSYVVELEGVGFSDLPAPGALALLALAGTASRRRRRA